MGLCEFRPADGHKFCSPFSIGVASLDPGGPCPSWVRRLLPGTPDLRAGHSLDRPVCPCAGGQRLPSAWVHVGFVQAEEPQRCTQCRGGARGLLPRDHSDAPATSAWGAGRGAGTVAALWTCPLLQTARFLALDEVALTPAPLASGQRAARRVKSGPAGRCRTFPQWRGTGCA